MPAVERYAAQVKALRAEHHFLIVNWVATRVVEESDLDAVKLRTATERYIDWAALVIDAAIGNLDKRKWHATRDAVRKTAADALAEASTNPTFGAKRMPTLLKSAFAHNAFVGFLGNDHAQIVAADLPGELQTGLVLVGEARGQEIHRATREAYRAIVLGLVNDIVSAGERSLLIPPEPLSTGQVIAPGSRTLSVPEQNLTGHWVNSESHSSGNFSARFELHMFLLATGQLARTSRSVATSSLRDSSGNWTGSLDAVSGLTPGERGRWHTDGALLTLEMDDGSAYEYRYTHQGASLLTANTNGGAQRYWTRSR